MADFHIWDGVWADFAAAPRRGQGFAGDRWHDRKRAAMTEDLRRLREDGTVPETAKFREYILPVVAAMAGQGRDRLRVLDFGGGMGNGFLPLLSDVIDSGRIEFHVVELERICDAGREIFAEGPAPIFHSALPEHLGAVDIVHAGSVLQYIEDWRGLLARLASYAPRYLLLSDVMAGPVQTFASIQNEYGDTIPHWFWNKDEFVAAAEDLGYRLLLQAPFVGTFLGKQGPLPMDNFPPERRLGHACHLLFAAAP